MKTIYRRRITDYYIVKLLRTDKALAAEVLYAVHAKFLVLAIFRIVKDRAIAEQLLPVAFKKIWGAIDGHSIEKGRLYTLMITIAKDVALNALTPAVHETRHLTHEMK